MKKLSYLSFLFLVLFIFSCEDSSTNPADVDGEWLIPKDQIYDGGPGKDGIPALTNPEFASASSTTYLKNNDLVIIIKFEKEIRMYPHPILDWHEIINDDINGNKFSLSYCPLTGTGIAWDRVINGKETTFGVSGLLYNSNLIPYDRSSNSNWSQIKLLSVNGIMIGTEATTFPVIETSWSTAKGLFPDAKVVTNSTGYSRSYGNYPYGDYKTNHGLLLFPVSPDDSRLPRKERVLGVILDGEARAYRFQQNGSNIDLLTDELSGKSLSIIHSKDKNILIAFENELEDGTEVSNFSAVQNQLPVIMIDDEGNNYNLFGEVTQGPQQGKKLKSVTSMMAYWFAWGAFYQNSSIAN